MSSLGLGWELKEFFFCNTNIVYCNAFFCAPQLAKLWFCEGIQKKLYDVIQNSLSIITSLTIINKHGLFNGKFRFKEEFEPLHIISILLYAASTLLIMIIYVLDFCKSLFPVHVIDNFNGGFNAIPVGFLIHFIIIVLLVISERHRISLSYRDSYSIERIKRIYKDYFIFISLTYILNSSMVLKIYPTCWLSFIIFMIYINFFNNYKDEDNNNHLNSMNKL